MTKNLINTAFLCVMLYYSFIDVVPILYWISTVLYILIGIIRTILAYGLGTRASWILPSKVPKFQSKFVTDSKIIFSVINIVIITSVLVYTGNYFHLLYPLTLVGFLISIFNYSK